MPLPRNYSTTNSSYDIHENFQETPSETFFQVELPFVIVKKQNTVIHAYLMHAQPSAKVPVIPVNHPIGASSSF